MASGFAFCTSQALFAHQQLTAGVDHMSPSGRTQSPRRTEHAISDSLGQFLSPLKGRHENTIRRGSDN